MLRSSDHEYSLIHRIDNTRLYSRRHTRWCTHLFVRWSCPGYLKRDKTCPDEKLRESLRGKDTSPSWRERGLRMRELYREPSLVPKRERSRHFRHLNRCRQWRRSREGVWRLNPSINKVCMGGFRAGMAAGREEGKGIYGKPQKDLSQQTRDVGPVLDWWWPNIKPTLVQRLVFARMTVHGRVKTLVWYFQDIGITSLDVGQCLAIVGYELGFYKSQIGVFVHCSQNHSFFY